MCVLMGDTVIWDCRGKRVFDQLCRSMEILLNKAEKENICILIGPEDWTQRTF